MGKILLMKTLLVISTLIFTGTAIANQPVMTNKPRSAPQGCKPNCDGIPAGKCSCVTIDFYTCCGYRTDGLKTKTTGQQQKGYNPYRSR